MQIRFTIAGAPAPAIDATLAELKSAPWCAEATFSANTFLVEARSLDAVRAIRGIVQRNCGESA